MIGEPLAENQRNQRLALAGQFCMIAPFKRGCTMLVAHTPGNIRPPFANYSHAIEVPPGWRILMCSGQLGIAPDEEVPAGTEAQARVCFSNIDAVLRSAGMSLSDVVRINAYVTGRDHLKPYMQVRDEMFGDPPPASTLMIVSGFAREEFTVEIEVVAAAPAKSAS